MNFNDVAYAPSPGDLQPLGEANRPYEPGLTHVALFGTSTDYHGLLRPLCRGAYLAGGGFTSESAEASLVQGRADAIVFGVAFFCQPRRTLTDGGRTFSGRA